MKYWKYLLIGISFGIVFTKGQVISWYRINEMFHFMSFHMYGIIGSAVMIGIIGNQFIKRRKLKDVSGKDIEFEPKDRTYVRYILGGTIFGLGWALGPYRSMPGTSGSTFGSWLWCLYCRHVLRCSGHLRLRTSPR
jgi:uncharacterized membrane protein YedE/YeeE